MRGADAYAESLVTIPLVVYFVPTDDPLRAMRVMVYQALDNLNTLFSGMYETDTKSWRPSIAPEKVLRAMLLQILLSIRSDNEPEFVSHAILEWIVQAGIGTSLSDPGKPWQNSTGESFSGKFRDECLSPEWFRSRREARVYIEAWRRHYNTVRPTAAWTI